MKRSSRIWNIFQLQIFALLTFAVFKREMSCTFVVLSTKLLIYIKTGFFITCNFFFNMFLKNVFQTTKPLLYYILGSFNYSHYYTEGVPCFLNKVSKCQRKICFAIFECIFKIFCRASVAFSSLSKNLKLSKK